MRFPGLLSSRRRIALAWFLVNRGLVESGGAVQIIDPVARCGRSPTRSSGVLKREGGLQPARGDLEVTPR
jgi:hypothetical protein